MGTIEILEYLVGICDQSDEDGSSYIGAAWLRGFCEEEISRIKAEALPYLLKPGDRVIEPLRNDPPVGTVRATRFDDCANVLYIQIDYGTGALYELPRESVYKVGPMPWEITRPIEGDDPEEILGMEIDDDWL